MSCLAALTIRLDSAGSIVFISGLSGVTMTITLGLGPTGLSCVMGHLPMAEINYCPFDRPAGQRSQIGSIWHTKVQSTLCVLDSDSIKRYFPGSIA